MRAELRPRGITVDDMDLLIGVTALVYDLTMVTHNTRHFQHIPNLRLEDWLPLDEEAGPLNSRQ